MNKVILIGRLGGDPETHGDVVAFSVATANGKDKAPTWHRVKVFEKQAEACRTYLRKGHNVGVDGYINNYKYTTKDGVEAYGTEVIASRVEFLTPKDPAEPTTTQAPTTTTTTTRTKKATTATAADSLPW